MKNLRMRLGLALHVLRGRALIYNCRIPRSGAYGINIGKPANLIIANCRITDADYAGIGLFTTAKEQS